MAQALPRLRRDLDFMPSPLAEKPGLLIRDPYHYSDATLIIPPVLVECLQFFDGERTDLDLRAALVQLTGDLRVGEVENHLQQTLRNAGFFEDETYARLKDDRHAEFAAAPVREPFHAGSAYAENAELLRMELDRCLKHARPGEARSELLGIAAPHVSFDGGARCYADAYAALGQEYADRVFVVLGTSHYGDAGRFGLTVKPFVTPLGETRSVPELVERLAASGGPAVKLEDYCHAVEHSIEFQVVYLQHRFGPGVHVLPILCGPFVNALQNGGRPEDDSSIGQFLSALADLAREERERLFWVLGIDMAHMGRRYGDLFEARAAQGKMAEVIEADRERIAFMESGDAEGFWGAVREEADPLKWCGSSPVYTFMRAVPDVRGELLRYEQWNIDPQSVVSFAAMAFTRQPIADGR